MQNHWLYRFLVVHPDQSHYLLIHCLVRYLDRNSDLLLLHLQKGQKEEDQTLQRPSSMETLFYGLYRSHRLIKTFDNHKRVSRTQDKPLKDHTKPKNFSLQIEHVLKVQNL